MTLRMSAKLIATVGGAILLFGGVPAVSDIQAANSYKIPSAINFTQPDVSSVEGSVAVPLIPDPLLDKLHELGLRGTVTSVQDGAKGGVYYEGEQGSWVINLSPNATSDPQVLDSSQAVAEEFDYGFCTGYFSDVREVANYLQWGGQSSCTASDNQYYLHEVEAELYDTCVGSGCVVLGYIITVYLATELLVLAGCNSRRQQLL